MQLGIINAGGITAILLYMFNIINSASELSESFFDFKQDQGQLKGLIHLSNEMKNNNDVAINICDDKDNSIIVKSVTVAVDDKIILNNISMKFKYKQHYMIKGDNGSGKTTLIMALLNVRKVVSGEVITSKFAKISYVPQKASFFIGSIADNLSLGTEVPKHKIVDVLKKVDLWNDLEINGGAEYIIDEQHSLSGGQLQKLAIARALIADANVLILDEVTANLDLNSKSSIKKLISEISKKMTVIEISHDSVVPDNAIVINLKEGRICT